MSINKRIILTNELGELEKLFSLLEEQQQNLALSQELVFNLRLALEEAVTNVILYAYPDGTSGQIELSMNVQDDILRFTLQDSGIAFNPLEDAPEADITSDAMEREIGGLGVFLVCQLMDAVIYERKDGYNCLIMIKEIR